MQRTGSFENTLCWERWKAGGEGDDRGWDGWMASPTQWTWVWVNSGAWWWTGRPEVHGVAKSWTWLTERLNWTDPRGPQWAHLCNDGSVQQPCPTENGAHWDSQGCCYQHPHQRTPCCFSKCRTLWAFPCTAPAGFSGLIWCVTLVAYFPEPFESSLAAHHALLAFLPHLVWTSLTPSFQEPPRSNCLLKFFSGCCYELSCVLPQWWVLGADWEGH